MTSTVCPYAEVPPGKIGHAIGSLFERLKQDGKSYTRSANANVVVLSSGPEAQGSVDALVETLSDVHPSRFFIIVPDSSSKGIKAEVSARVVPVSKSENSCSDLIKLTAPEASIDAVAEILRAQFLSGMSIELCLFDSKVPKTLIEKIDALVDSVMYDSAAFDARPEVLEWLVDSKTQDVDTQWLLLGPWRDEIRRVFDRAATRDLLSSLSGIAIDHTGPDPDAVPACAFLIAGWVGDRLGLRAQPNSGARSVLFAPKGKEIDLSFSRRAVTGDGALASITFRFGDKGEVVLSREGGAITSDVRIDPVYRAARPLEDDSRESALRRHFLIGESIANYPAAFRLGLSLRSRTSGRSETPRR